MRKFVQSELESRGGRGEIEENGYTEVGFSRILHNLSACARQWPAGRRLGHVGPQTKLPDLRLTEGQCSSRTGCWGPLSSRQEACVESSDHRRLMMGCESCC